MTSVLAGQLRNVKVETFFIELSGLGVPGSAWEAEQLFLWEQKSNAISEPRSAF